jgi:hypothetical protein
VTAMGDGLRRHLKSEPIHAQPYTFTYRAVKFVASLRAINPSKGAEGW